MSARIQPSLGTGMGFLFIIKIFILERGMGDFKYEVKLEVRVNVDRFLLACCGSNS